MGVPNARLSERIPSEEGPAHTVELAKNTVLQKLECGFYDPGYVARMVDAPVQPGCVYHAVTRGDDQTRSAFAGAVPAAAQIEADAAWKESVVLRGPNPNKEAMVPGSSRPEYRPE